MRGSKYEEERRKHEQTTQKLKETHYFNNQIQQQFIHMEKNYVGALRGIRLSRWIIAILTLTAIGEGIYIAYLRGHFQWLM